jgi:hypothetical protein
MNDYSCILRVDRMFEGFFQARESRDFKCRTGRDVLELRRVRTEINWRFSTPVECDESAAIVSPFSVISARGVTIVRDDGFAHFRGRMVITDFFEDQPPARLFRGRVDVIGRIGSHQSLGEPCDPREHFEAWFTATGVGSLVGYRLRCIAAGTGTLPEGPVIPPSDNRINGTLFLPA